jgi:hypothetical protein
MGRPPLRKKGAFKRSGGIKFLPRDPPERLAGPAQSR